MPLVNPVLEAWIAVGVVVIPNTLEGVTAVTEVHVDNAPVAETEPEVPIQKVGVVSKLFDLIAPLSCTLVGVINDGADVIANGLPAVKLKIAPLVEPVVLLEIARK